jgi:non-specific serine/threonine protein kinase
MNLVSNLSGSGLIGRADELDQIGSLLQRDDAPMVTLSGPGGVGKTRLARALSADLASGFSDGIFFVELSSLRDSDLVMAAIANELNLRDGGGGSTGEKLIAHFRRRRSLLVLDNLEHLVQAGPGLVEMLNECPQLKMLTTSRVPLRLSLEHTVTVQPLEPPAAVQLFVQRAKTAAKTFRLTSSNQRATAEICERLDRLPLAIELAAARVESMSPTALLDRLDRALPLLTGGDARQPDRLRTMRDAIAWSYDLLEPGEQALFRRLAIFAGGIDPGRVNAVTGFNAEAGETLDTLTSLVEKNLLQPIEMPGRTAVRYRMLETVREFGLEQLSQHDELTAVQTAYAEHFAALAAGTSLGQYSAAFAETLNALDVEHANAQAVMEWAIATDTSELGIELAAALGPYWIFRGHYRDGREWIERFIASHGPEPTQARARALVRAGWLANLHGDVAGADKLLADGIEAGLQSGEENMVAQGRIAQSLVKLQQRDYPAAAFNASEAFRLYPLLDPGNPNFEYWASMALTILGQIASLEGKGELASEYSKSAVQRLGTLPAAWALGASLRVLGDLAHDAGDTSWAWTYYRGGIQLALDRSDHRLMAEVLSGVASLAQKNGDSPQAARLYGAVSALREREGITEGWDRREHERRISLVRTVLSERDFEIAWAEGESISLDELFRELSQESPKAEQQQAGKPSSLTPREIEVLRLVARGYSNVEIGEELGISRRTAGVHVSNLLAKLNLETRTAAAALALREGLA